MQPAGLMRDSPGEIVVECLGKEELAADEAWWGLYESAFPASEREPRDVIFRSLELGVGVAFRARREGRTIGLATTHLLRRPPTVFLVYLAVDSTYRGAGVGRELFEVAWQVSAEKIVASGERPLGYVWEVDPAPADGAVDVCRRRVGFFERQGGRVITRKYRQPPVDGINIVPMWLMYRPAPTDGAVDIDVLVRAMYREKYGQVNGIDVNRLLDRRDDD